MKHTSRLLLAAIAISGFVLVATLVGERKPSGAVQPAEPRFPSRDHDGGPSTELDPHGLRVRSDRVLREEPAAEAASRASVRLMDTVTRRAPLGSRWIVESEIDSEAAVEFVVEGEALSLPAGSWRFSCVEGGWSTVRPGPLEIGNGPKTLLVGEPLELNVRAVDPGGQGVADARLFLTRPVARRGADGLHAYWNESDLIASATTGADGRAQLVAAASQPAVLYISARGFRSASRRLLSASDLTVRLEPSEPPTEDYAVLEYRTRRPLPGVRLWGRQGPVSTASGGEGRLALLEAVSGSTRLQVRGEGVAPTYIRLDDCVEREILVLPTSTLEIRIAEAAWGSTERPAVLLFREPDDLDSADSGETRFDGGGSAFGEPVVPERAEARDGGALRAVVPAWVPIRVVALFEDGAASAVIAAEPGHDVVELAVGASEPLVVHLPDPSARLLLASNVEYGNRSRVFLDDRPASATLSVPAPEDVREVLVHVEGFAPIQLRPHPDRAEGPSQGGDVTPEWVPTHEGHFVVQDAEGIPVGGAALRFSWSRSHAPVHPGLSGFAPTDHPGWVERVAPRIEGHTDVEGELTVSLPAGSYTVWVDPAGGLSLSNRGGSGYRLAYALDIHEDARFDWTVPNLRLVSVKAYTGAGEPSRGFEVKVSGGMAGSVSKSNGSFWQRWLPSTAQELSIRSSSGGSGAQVPLVPWTGEQLKLEVTLGDVPGAIELSGQQPSWSGARVKVVARASALAGAPVLLDHTYPIGERGWVSFDVPGHTHAVVEARVVLPGGRELATSPPAQDWHPSAVLRFSVEENDR